MSIIDEMFANMRRNTHMEYGERVTIVAHSIQTAVFAERDGADDLMIAAAFLHDYGHFVHDLGEDIAEKGIDGLKGKQNYLERYNQYIQSSKENDEDTEDMDDDELQLDDKQFAEIDVEGIEYLEEENSGDIYSTSYQIVGKWDDNYEDIIWTNDSFRLDHETKKD